MPVDLEDPLGMLLKLSSSWNLEFKITWLCVHSELML